MIASSHRQLQLPLQPITQPLNTISSSSSSSRPPITTATTAIKHTIHDNPPQLPQPATTTTTNKPKEKERAGKLTEQWPLPPNLIQRDTNDQLIRGNLLGEGGFARVFLATEPNGGKKALKVIAKDQLKSTKNKSKLFGEIKIHQAMQHPNIVSFEHCFEDTSNVYMQLELCSNGSLLDILRKRRRYTEPEARFYLVQLIGACDYMHSNSVIHRDLKLGNLMLDEEMNLRVGDFGLAALVKFPGERKKTICGTPNYIAPEILFDTTNGHSFEVDIWSIGVILYTVLVGRPPFQTKEVKNIYKKIKDNNYVFPPEVELSPEAVDLISCILTTQPDKRPTLFDILSHPFFTSGPFPSSISSSSLTSPPDYRTLSIRASHRNFKLTKLKCGLKDDEVSTASVITTKVERVVEKERVEKKSKTVLQVVNEESEEEKRESVVAVKVVREDAEVVRGMEKGMEKEVRQVLQPESPIADLLRSARKPLMVSPRSIPPLSAPAFTSNNTTDSKDTIQRRVFSATTTVVNQERERERERERRLVEKENAAPVGVRLEKGSGSAGHRRQLATSGVSVGTTAVVGKKEKKEKETLPLPPKTSTTVISKHPALDLYKDSWRSLDSALQNRSSSGVDLLPHPLPEEGGVVAPKVFITSWVDYTHKYGTAYSLTDGSAGLYFNDSTTMVLSPDKIHYDYISSSNGSIYQRRHYKVSPSEHPPELERKTYLLEYFEDYMSKTLLREVPWTFLDSGRKRNMDFLVKYYRMKNAIVFKLSNGVLQFNFYDHTKLLLTSNASIISFIDPDFQLQTFSLQSLFREASRLGHFRTNPTADPNGLKRLEELRFMMDKLVYCRDVLKTLWSRRENAVAAGAVVKGASSKEG